MKKDNKTEVPSIEVIEFSSNSYPELKYEVKRNAEWISWGHDNLAPQYQNSNRF